MLGATPHKLPSETEWEVTPPPMREKQDSREITTDALLQEAAERGAKLRAAEAANAAKDAEIARLRAEAGRVVAAPAEPTEKQRRKAVMHAAVVKAVVALAGLLGAATTYLAVHSASTIPPKVESVDVRTSVVETATGIDHKTQLQVIEYLRAEQARRECLDSQMASALARGTGHRVSGSANTVEWVESSMPTRRPTLVWDRAVWFPASPCAAPTRLP